MSRPQRDPVDEKLFNVACGGLIVGFICAPVTQSLWPVAVGAGWFVLVAIVAGIRESGKN